MLTLPDKIRKNGFNYTLVSRGRTSCLYAQTVTKNLKYYEVFIIRVAPEKNINGTIIPSKEVFPRNEDFGKYAWSLRTLAKAMDKFFEIENLVS